MSDLILRYIYYGALHLTKIYNVKFYLYNGTLSLKKVQSTDLFVEIYHTHKTRGAAHRNIVFVSI